MTALVLIGLMLVSAKLWLDLGVLRGRVSALEVGPEPLWFPEVIEPAPPSERTV